MSNNVGIEREVSDGQSDDRPCATCGEEVRRSWAFCGICGAVVDGAADDTLEGQFNPSDASPAVLVPLHPESRQKSGHRRRRKSGRWVVVWSLVALVVVGLTAWGGSVHLQTRNDLDSTRGALASSQDQLKATSATLETTEADLETAQADLTSTSDELRTTEEKLRAAKRKLAGARGSLDSAQDRLDLQSNHIETLKSCLNGVSTALSHAAYQDYVAAVAALDAVQVSCDRAQEML